MNSKYSFKSPHFGIQMRFKLKKIQFKNMHCFQNFCHSIYYRLICWFYSLMWFIMILNHLKADHVQPKTPLFTSDSQHPPRFRHAVYLGAVPYFRGDWSWNNFYAHSPPFRWFIQERLLSVTSESMCTNYWLTACSSLPKKKCG